MAGMDWFRWHHGSVNDPKFRLIACKTGASVAEVVAVWASLLEEASQAEDRGRLGVIDFEAIDCHLGLEDGQSQAIHGVMTDRGLLASDGSVVAWEKRQPKREREDPTSTERSRASRARKASIEACNAEAQLAAANASEDSRESPERANASDATPRNATQHQETPRGEESREEEKEHRETKVGSASRKRSAHSPDRPEDVTEQVWSDWLALRKAKRAPVSETVLSEARSEAAKALLSLDRFLAVWCIRGSQGLQADWLRPEERGRPLSSQPRPAASEPAWRTEQRLRMQQLAPGVAARPVAQPQQPEFIDVEARDAHAPRLA